MQIFLNFLSNSLKFTGRNGVIDVDIKVKSLQQICSKEQMEQMRRHIA